MGIVDKSENLVSAVLRLPSKLSLLDNEPVPFRCG